MSKDIYDHMTDQELLDHFNREKDSRYLGIVLERYTFLLLGVCMKYLKNEEASKDAVQQIFLKAIVELGKYKVDYLKSWLYMIAKNHCLMSIRGKHLTLPIEERTGLIDPENEIREIKEKEATLMVMETALEQLNGEQKTCVTLFYLDKKSYQEIAEQTGFSLLQVKSFIQNGKRNLRILVEKKMKANS